MGLQIMELEVHDAKALFHLLDEDHSGEVQYEEFLNGVTKLKGQSRQMDIIIMLRKMESIERDVKKLVRLEGDIKQEVQQVGGRIARTSVVTQYPSGLPLNNIGGHHHHHPST